MLFKKTLIFTILFLANIVYAVEMQPFFPDVTPNDPAYKAIVKYTQQGTFSGIDGRAELDDVITKEHATFFLLKVLGIAKPTIETAIGKDIISSPPPSDQLLDHATWVKMLGTAFNVPLGNSAEGQPWYVAPYVVAQGINAIEDEKPFDLTSRRFVLRSTDLYERIFGAKNATSIMDEQELRLMKIRDMLINPQSTNDAIEKLVWKNILTAEEVPDNTRIKSIKYLNMSALVLFEIRKYPNESKKAERQARVAFFVERATTALPDVGPFAQDLLKIAQR